MKSLLPSSATHALRRLFTATVTPWLTGAVLIMLSAWCGFQMGAPVRQPVLADQLPTSMPGRAAASSAPTTSAPQSPAFSSSPSVWTTAAQETSGLSHQEARSSPPMTAAAEPQTPVRADGLAGKATTRAARAASAPVSVPLAFRNVDPVALGFTAVQIAGLEEVRGRFTQQVGQQNPADPAYRARWISAQSLADQMLRAKLGWAMFNQYQMQASQIQ